MWEITEYAHEMGTSVQMLMENYVQVPENKGKEEYQGVGDLSSDEAEDEKPQKRQATRTTTKSIKRVKSG